MLTTSHVLSVCATRRFENFTAEERLFLQNILLNQEREVLPHIYICLLYHKTLYFESAIFRVRLMN